MTLQQIKKILFVLWGVAWFIWILFYFVGGDQLDFAQMSTGQKVQATNDVGQLTTGRIIEQNFQMQSNYIDSIILYGTDYGHTVGGTLSLSLWNNQEMIREREIDMALLSNPEGTVISFDPPVQTQGNDFFTLRIEVKDGSVDSVPTLYYGSSISLARGGHQLSIPEEQRVKIDGTSADGMLCFQANGRKTLWFGQHYWAFVAVFMSLLTLLSIVEITRCKNGKTTFFMRGIVLAQRYQFLMNQLISRDFKSKYKRSILGILWSFLNPMLMMTVQYIVFSTIFKSDIENFAVYLLTGIVCYNFFNEVTNMDLTSIVGNASLITKVYIPKVIYPFSRAVSSMINFLLSLIPLLVVMLFTHTRITPAVALLPFAVVCLFMLSLGVGLVLASLMVFFRDTQFLWNVLGMVWMYMTPIFYPENIVSGWLNYIFKLNPLYHIIRFFRIVILNGVSPEPKAYLFCLFAALIPLAVGVLVFKKTEDKFVLYI